MMKTISLLRRVTLVAVAAGTLGGCAALVVGGAVGTALLAVDRRSPGVQIEDQAIELKAGNRIRESVGERGHVSATSYNRILLLTGEVASEADRTAIEQNVSRIENLRSTVNELAVMGASSFTARSNDTVLTSKVKASYLDAKDLQANVIKVVTERGTVFLMGRVTEREATRATDLARGVSGVQKVVRVFEILTEAELAALGGNRS
ncbi:MAG: BON domain-containing protein [Pseudomonadota bacterium]